MTGAWCLARRAAEIPLLAAALLCASFGAACGEDPVAPTLPTTIVNQTETFTGSLAASGASSDDFTVGADGTVSVTLASLLAAGSPVSISVTIGVGAWDATASTCTIAPADQVTTAPALTAQLVVTMTAGPRCFTITDVNAAGPVDFTTRVVHR